MIKATCDYVVYPRKKTYDSEDYIIARFKTSAENIPAKYRDGKRVITFTAKGKGIPTSKKFDALLEGKWKWEEKYGLSLIVEKSDIATPSDKDGIISYLVTFLQGCGVKTANKIYDKFGQATIMVISSDPYKLLEVEGLRKRQVERMLKSYKETQHLQELTTLLSPYGISRKKIELIYNAFGENAVETIKSNPFVLEKYRGFSFETLDTMSQRFECSPAEPLRIKAALKSCLRLAMTGSNIFDEPRLKNGGNLFVNQYTLRSAALTLLNTRAGSQVSQTEVTNVIWTMYQNKELLGEKGNVYLPDNYYYEQMTARFVAEILYESKAKKYSDSDIESALSGVERDMKIELSNNQREAVFMVLQNPLSIITGGAGTGKTTVLKVILSCLKVLGENMDNVMLAAPTGKAGIRMTESTGYPACTLHKALGIVKEDDFEDEEAEITTLESTTDVVDEYSMVDMKLAYRMFLAVDRKKSRVLMVGDVGQLPSVGAGKVLNDFIECGKIPVTALKCIFRQAQESNIVRNSANINKGVHFLEFEKDFLINELSDTESILEAVISKYVDEIKKYGLDEVCILSPIKNKGNLCTNALNKAIQDLVNPKREQNERTVQGVRYREGDKIIQLKNILIDDMDICNGDTGYIKKIVKGEDGYIFRINFAGNRKVEFTEDDMKHCTLAYAITIHKSQGSEYKSVIMPLHSYMPTGMMTRNLLYTGVTRAKERLNIVGEKKVIHRAIDNNIANNRNTALADKIIYYCNYYEEVA